MPRSYVKKGRADPVQDWSLSGITWHDMALVDGDDDSELPLRINQLGTFPFEPPKLGVARSNRARVTIWFRAVSRLTLRALRIKRPNQTEPFPSTVSSAWLRSPYVVFLPLLIWTN